jgi:phosphatidylglycerophosphate synthase
MEEKVASATGERRPIKSRDVRVFQVMALRLARMGISANTISLAGMIVAFGAAAALVRTAYVDGWDRRVMYLAAAGGIQLRLLANMLDGMVAIASGKSSAVGELYNEIPDRLSDTAILVAAGYAAFSHPTLGWAAAGMALFITYLRALGNSLGVKGLFVGPMSKSHRMFTLTMACLWLALTPASLQPQLTFTSHGPSYGLMAIALALVILGGALTALRRLARIVAALKRGRP